MYKPKLAIVGANNSINLLIEKAKSLGYETHVFAWKSGAIGEKTADVFYPISIADKEAILQKCQELNVVGICSVTSDFAAPVVNFVSKALGKPHNEDKTDLLARNKYEMRKAFKEAGVYVPRFIEVSEDFNLEMFKDFSFPVIVKPTDRWSSKGVNRVDNIEQLESAISVAINESMNHLAIVEEFMEGPEYSAECIAQDGEYHILAFTKKQTTGFPHYIETGHLQPSDIPTEKHEYIKQVIFKALRALGIRNSAAHAEFRLLANGEVGIIEIGARMGGDCIGTDLTPISTGMDYIKMVIDVAVGNKLDFSLVSKPTPVRVKFIMNKEDLDEFYRIQKNHPNSIIRFDELDNDFSRDVVDSSTRHGFYVIKMEE